MVAPERPGVVLASTRISARQPAILEYRLAGTPACIRGRASEAAATPEAKSRDAEPYPEVAPDNRPDSPTGTGANKAIAENHTGKASDRAAEHARYSDA